MVDYDKGSKSNVTEAKFPGSYFLGTFANKENDSLQSHTQTKRNLTVLKNQVLYE